jgi:hypothetical protein
MATPPMDMGSSSPKDKMVAIKGRPCPEKTPEVTYVTDNQIEPGAHQHGHDQGRGHLEDVLVVRGNVQDDSLEWKKDHCHDE